MLAQFALGGREIEREHGRVAATFPSRRGLPFIGDKTLEASAQKRPEAALRRIVGAEEILLDRAREKTLRIIRRIVGVATPLHADKFVNGLPVRVD